MDSVSHLNKLYGLSVKDTPIDGTGLAKLDGVKTLGWVFVSKDKIDKEAKEAFQRFHPTTKLHLR